MFLSSMTLHDYVINDIILLNEMLFNAILSLLPDIVLDYKYRTTFDFRTLIDIVVLRYYL